MTTMTMQTGTMTGTRTTKSRKFLSEELGLAVVVGGARWWLSKRVVYWPPLYCSCTSYVQCYNMTLYRHALTVDVYKIRRLFKSWIRKKDE